MPRCRKILANGKRCKARAISGSKFCLFHTPGQRMKRGKKKTSSSVSGRSKKSTFQTTAENQIAMRGSRFLGGAIAAHALRYINRPDYRIVRTAMPARVNTQGTVFVRAHERRVIEPTRSDWGRGFKQTDNPKRKRESANTRYRAGKIIPYLGIGYMAYNLGTNWGAGEEPVIKANPEGFWLYDVATAGEWVAKQTVKAGIINVLTGGMLSAGDIVSD